MTKIEIIESVMRRYIKDPSKRSSDPNTGICVYNGPDGKHCAVGHCLKGKFKSGKIDLDYLDDSGISYIAHVYGIDKILQKKYQGHSIGFWEDLQVLHDRRDYWTSDGLSPSGERRYEILLERYKD